MAGWEASWEGLIPASRSESVRLRLFHSIQDLSELFKRCNSSRA